MNFNKLKTETDVWVSEGIISPAQAGRILKRYDHEVPLYKKMSFWLQCVAAVLGGLALFLVISENWQHMNWAVQSLIAALPLLAAHLWALWHEKKDNPLAAEIGWFIASIALGANIMLQAQIFHISAYYPNGILFWVIGILPVIWLRGSTVNFLLAAVLFASYLGMQISHHQFSALSVLPLAVLAWFTWSRQQVYTILPLLWVVYMFLLMVLEKWGTHRAGIVWEYAMLFFSLAFLQQFVRLKEDWLRRILWLLFGFTILLNILLTFRHFARSVHLGSESLIAFLIMGIAFASLLVNRNSMRQKYLTLLAAANIGATMLCILLQKTWLVNSEENPHLFMRVAANLIYLGSTVALLFKAIATREKAVFLISVMMLLLWALIRYIDLFKNYLVTALIFGLSAAALVFLNKLWERKYEN